MAMPWDNTHRPGLVILFALAASVLLVWFFAR
jgi:hypothetical protein